MAEKTPNYSPAQESLILAAIAANDGIANKSVAETLATNSAMNGAEGPRSPRAIIAKMTRMEVNYQPQAKLTKDGKEVTKKNDLVARIAALAEVSVASLAGLEKAPKPVLETLVASYAA